MTRRQPARRREWVLGVAASHNGAACLMKHGELVVAVQEERVTRRKRAFLDARGESFAITYCLDYAGIGAADLAMAVVCTPFRPEVADLSLNPVLRLGAHEVPVRRISHHLGHAAAVFATSGFEDSAVLVIDGMGSSLADVSAAERACALPALEDASTAALAHEHASLYEACGTTLSPIEKHVTPLARTVGSPRTDARPRVPPYGSLGNIFNSAAALTFGDFHEAGKVMGLAPYGRPKIPIERFFEIVGGTFRFRPGALDRYLDAGRWPRRQEIHATIAASVQAAVETGILYLVRRLRRRSRSRNLCYAGGVALNSIANERILREGGFERVYFMPAAEDSGTAIGAAAYGSWQLGFGNRRRRLEVDAVGRRYDIAEIERTVKNTPALARVRSSHWISSVVDLLCDGKFVGWFSGRSELGPRALGQRSILCDPRRARMRDVLNRRIKHRESFRPFAPVVLQEEAAAWFEHDGRDFVDSPFMLRVCKFREEKRERVRAVVHVDGTGRLQTVTKEANPDLHAVIREFFARTGVPMLLNTSFNVAGEPIVETPADALWCLLGTGLDYCVLDRVIVGKKPGYRSLLHLYPVLGRISTVAIDAPVVEVRVETRYGARTQIVDLATLDLLERVTGRVTGWQLLQGLNRSRRARRWSERRLARHLDSLRAASVLTFRDQPSV